MTVIYISYIIRYKSIDVIHPYSEVDGFQFSTDLKDIMYILVGMKCILNRYK